jgi:hypothetical protein
MVYLLNMLIFYSLIATSMLIYQRVPFRTGLKIATGRFHDPNQWGETAEAPPVLPLGSRRTFAWHRSTFCAPKIEWSMQVNNQQSNNIFTSLHICYFSGPSMPFRTTELPIFMNFAGHQKKPRHFAGRILHLDADAWGLWSCCRYLGATAERYPKRRNRWGSTESFCSDASTSSSETSMTFIDLGISALKWTSTQKLKMEPELSGVFGCTFFAPIGKVLTISRSKWLNTIWVGVVL